MRCDNSGIRASGNECLSQYMATEMLDSHGDVVKENPYRPMPRSTDRCWKHGVHNYEPRLY